MDSARSCLVRPLHYQVRRLVLWHLTHWACHQRQSALPRDGEPGSAGAGWARLPHAVPSGLPRVFTWDDEALLEEGARWETYVRVPPVLPGGLFYRHRATVPAWREPIACLAEAFSLCVWEKNCLKIALIGHNKYYLIVCAHHPQAFQFQVLFFIHGTTRIIPMRIWTDTYFKSYWHFIGMIYTKWNKLW